MQPAGNFRSRVNPPRHATPGGTKEASRSTGMIGHFVHLGATLSPMLINELVEDSQKRRRLIGLVSVGSAITYEILHTWRKQKREEERERDSQHQR